MSYRKNESSPEIGLLIGLIKDLYRASGIAFGQ